MLIILLESLVAAKLSLSYVSWNSIEEKQRSAVVKVFLSFGGTVPSQK